MTLGRVLAAYHATKSLAHLLEDDEMGPPLPGLDCLTCLARVGDDGTCWCSAAIGEAEYENEDFYDEPTCEFCGCSKSVWCEHDLL